MTIAHPEAIAGRWETADGRGGMVGMNIIVETHISGTPQNLLGQTQFLSMMEVGFYRRKEGDVGTLGFNFVTNETNGGLLWDGRHLRGHFPKSPIAPQISMNLVWHENLHSWTGHFERGSFSRDVVLLRPKNPHKSSFVGTWFNRSQLMNNCVHIAQQEDGGFTAWGDDILLPGRMRYANGIHPPDESRERYAEIAKAKLIAKDRISVELRAYTAACCSHPFFAKIAGDGKRFKVSFLPVQIKRLEGRIG